MITIKDFSVGEPCYIAAVHSGRRKDQEIREVTVQKVGRKYVYVNDIWERKYENHATDYLLENTSYRRNHKKQSKIFLGIIHILLRKIITGGNIL